MHVQTRVLVAAALLAAGASAGAAHAGSASIEFMKIGSQSASSDFGLEVSMVGSNQVSFMFSNSGSATISGVFLNHGSLISLNSIINGPGVSFVAGGAPKSLPGGGPFGLGKPVTIANATGGLSGGIASGQWMEMIFTLQSGATIANLFDAIEAGMGNPSAAGAVLIGLFAGGGPAGGSFVASGMNAQFPGGNGGDGGDGGNGNGGNGNGNGGNGGDGGGGGGGDGNGGVNAIPLPAPIWIGLAGLGLVAVTRKSLRQKA